MSRQVFITCTLCILSKGPGIPSPLTDVGQLGLLGQSFSVAFGQLLAYLLIGQIVSPL